jgi:hypothetical protein
VLTIIKIIPASQAASCAPLITSPANGVEAISSVTKPMACDLSVRSSLAVAFGLYRSSRADALTRVLVLSGMPLPTTSLSTNDTVVGETPASLATSPMVGDRLFLVLIVLVSIYSTNPGAPAIDSSTAYALDSAWNDCYFTAIFY